MIVGNFEKEMTFLDEKKGQPKSRARYKRDSRICIVTALVAPIVLTVLLPTLYTYFGYLLSNHWQHYRFSLDLGATVLLNLANYGIPILFGLILGVSILLLALLGGRLNDRILKTSFTVAFTESLVLVVGQILTTEFRYYSLGQYAVLDFALPIIATMTFLAGLIMVYLMSPRHRRSQVASPAENKADQ